jgi:hypothetical protein
MITPAVMIGPRIGGGSDDSVWVGGSNRTTAHCTRPASTLARRPTDFKSATQIQTRATEGMSVDRRLSLDEKNTKISMTSWVNAIREYMEEHGLDTVFRIFDEAEGSEVYVLQDWGKKADPTLIRAWEKTLETGVGTLQV